MRIPAPARAAMPRLGEASRTARIVLLNGPGSVGKSSVARAMQTIARRPLLHVAMDTFLDMLPETYADHPDTFRFTTRQEFGHSYTEVERGPVGSALMAAMRRSVAALAAEGLDLVVDDVWLDGEPGDYRALLSGHFATRVGLSAPLDVLEAREAARGDRLPGLSRAQVGRVNEGVAYDLMLDMGQLTPEAAAHRIVAAAGL